MSQELSTHRAQEAVTRLYHAYFTGLLLTLASRRGATDAADWTCRVFRHQHHEKFLVSFDKLGLSRGCYLRYSKRGTVSMKAPSPCTIAFSNLM